MCQHLPRLSRDCPRAHLGLVLQIWQLTFLEFHWYAAATTTSLVMDATHGVRPRSARFLYPAPIRCEVRCTLSTSRLFYSYSLSLWLSVGRRPDSGLGKWGEPYTFIDMLPRISMMPRCRTLVTILLRQPETFYPSLQRHQFAGLCAHVMRCGVVWCGDVVWWCGDVAWLDECAGFVHSLHARTYSADDGVGAGDATGAALLLVSGSFVVDNVVVGGVFVVRICGGGGGAAAAAWVGDRLWLIELHASCTAGACLHSESCRLGDSYLLCGGSKCRWCRVL